MRLLSLSHDEVVHGKRSLLDKMPGDGWQKFANLRLLLGFMYMHPGKKLLFMGAEIGQWDEWDHDSSLEWHLLQYERHRGIQQWLRDLNMVYKKEPALYEIDFENSGFRWVDASDWSQSVVSFIRRGKAAKETILVVCNCTPVPRYNYRIGVPSSGLWKEILNSDSEDYWGSGHGNFGGLEAEPAPFHGMRNSLSLTLPPLGIVVLKG
jgi:1,4-alpha-glucan branching enzyme